MGLIFQMPLNQLQQYLRAEEHQQLRLCYLKLYLLLSLWHKKEKKRRSGPEHLIMLYNTIFYEELFSNQQELSFSYSTPHVTSIQKSVTVTNQVKQLMKPFL